MARTAALVAARRTALVAGNGGTAR
jgi:hypothetical protein